MWAKYVAPERSFFVLLTMNYQYAAPLALEILSDAISQIYADKFAFLNPNGIQSISLALERSDYAGVNSITSFSTPKELHQICRTKFCREPNSTLSGLLQILFIHPA